MKPVHMALIGAGALGVGYLIFRPGSANAASMSGDYLPPVKVKETAADAAAKAAAITRAMVGAKAAAGASAGKESVLASVGSGVNAKVSSALGDGADKVIPGSGGFVSAISSKGIGTVGGAVSSGLSKLKFW